jgi:DNA-binding MarR family transcriptional regulator
MARVSIKDARRSFGLVYRADIDCDEFRELSPTARLVYVALTLFASATREAYPRVSTIAAVVGVSERGVHRALVELSEAGFISIDKRQIGPRRYNTYTLLER